MIVNTTRKTVFALIAFLSFQLLEVHAAPREEATRLKVAVTIEPLAVFARGVTGDTADITVLVPPGADPHTYEPRPALLKELSRSDVLVKTGAGLDIETAFIDKITALNPKLVVCDSSKGIKLLDAEDHRCSGENCPSRHRHGAKDPHIWLSPANAIKITDNIRRALTRANPDNGDFYAVSAREYTGELAALDAEIRNILAPARGRVFLVVHPAWGYFAEDYGLEEVAIRHAGKEPTVKGLVNMIKKAQRTGAGIVFISPQFDPKSAEVIAAETGARLVVADPLSGDYSGNLRYIAEQLAEN